MDAERVDALITAIEKRPNLYDKTSPGYSNRNYLNAEWKKIAEEVGCTEIEARKRWKKLRDYFQKNQREMHSYEAGSAASKKKKWYLHDRMLFLLPYVNDRNSTANMATLSFDDGDMDIKDRVSQAFPCSHSSDTPTPSPFPKDESNGHEDHSANPSITSDQLPHSPLSRRKPKSFPQYMYRRNQSDSENETSAATQHSWEGRENAPETYEDEYFFKSLIPKMKLLSTIDKMECQAEIHSTVLKYIKKASADADL